MTTLTRLPRMLGRLGAAGLVSLACLPALAQTEGGELIAVQASNPPSLDAMSTSSQASRNINMNIYETLYGFGEDITPIPILAEGVEISDDGLTYVFPLRQGVLFHNGKEMTARDVKASLDRYREVGATANLLAPVKDIEITGDYEVTFHMVEPTPTFLESFSSPRAPAVIIPEEDGRGGGGRDEPHRHRAVPVRRIRSGQPRHAREVRRLHGGYRKRWPGRLRRQQDGLPRPGDLPHHPRTRRAGGSARGRRGAPARADPRAVRTQARSRTPTSRFTRTCRGRS